MLTEGGIPEDWVSTTLRSVIDFVIDNRGKTPPLASHGIPLLEINSIYGEVTTPDASKFSKYVNKEVYESWFRCGHPVEGDVLVATVGAAGVTAISDASETCIAQNIIGLRPSKSIVAEYLFQFTKSDKFKRQVKAVLMGAVQPSLKVPHLLDFNFTYPSSRKEQALIACVLSDIGNLIGGLDQLIAKKRDIKQATMQQLLTGQQRLPGFSGEWQVKQLGEFSSFLKGKGLPKSELSLSGVDPCIHYGELFTIHPETIGDVISRTNGSRDAFRSIANDVLMPTSDVTPRGLAKASCITIDGVILGGDILIIRSDTKKINGSFLSYVIRQNKDQILQLVTGSTVFHLYGSDMKRFTFSIPPVAEQTAITTILSDMDSELTTLETRRDKAHQLKQGLMQELLTGRIRLVSQTEDPLHAE